jgi:hypothetical protein
MRRYATGFFLVLLGVACGAAGGTSTDSGGTGTGGAAGASSGKGGAGGSGTGTGGTSQMGGSPGVGGSFIGGGGETSTGGSAPTDGGGVQDALPDVGDTDACTTGGTKGPGPVPHNCAAATANECDGKTDTNAALPNGMYGNGFDDDCDGIVDEGCSCDPGHAPGTTRDCWLVPASQVEATSNQPPGWCKENSHGTMACIQPLSGEFTQTAWDGFCKGAQPPFADDACAPGDFDCDGAPQNPKKTDCSCQQVEVTCPSDAVVISPYPYLNDLEKKKPNPFDPKPNDPFVVDGATWVGGGLGSKATGWKWTLTGGDCDNILPHTTFGVFTGKDTTNPAVKRVGFEMNNLGTNKKQKGIVVGPANDAHQIWPAFSLSGDYVVQGEFDLQGQHYQCTLKVKVRAPGLRAEMCWDMAASASLGLTSTDLDLHVSRLQGASCAGKHGWFDACGKAPSSDDCYYQCDSGCRTGNTGFCVGTPSPKPGWGYAPSGNESCHGWGSLREPGQSCDNPRLDRDNLGCNTNIIDPTAYGGFDNPLADFCGPENINLDNPNAGDQFLVGVHYYGGDAPTHPHVNIYCNGERKLALGYDPTTTPPTMLPVLSTSFSPQQSGMGPQYYNGDMWETARVTWSGAAGDPCLIEPVPSKTPKAAKDGTPNYCVDTNQQNKANATDADRWYFTSGGNYPAAPAAAGAACWH